MGYENNPTYAAVGNSGQCTKVWSGNLMGVMKAMGAVKPMRVRTFIIYVRIEVVANTCASSRGNTWATSVIHLDWAYRMRRHL